MEHFVVKQWRANCEILDAWADVVGWNWQRMQWNHSRGHFAGTFWIAKPDYLRTLPEFWRYHADCGKTRFTCETWVGCNHGVKYHSHGCLNWNVWHDTFDWQHFGEWDFTCRLKDKTK